MNLLRTAVVDITTLVATGRALDGRPVGELDGRRKLRDRLRSELRRGTVAYIETLARSKRGTLDAELLAACRAAAEREMPRALLHQEELKRRMGTQPGALAGVAAARQDLWRLAHMTIYLRQGIAAIRDQGGRFAEAEKKSSDRLRRRFRRALLAYARATHREKATPDRLIVAARDAALREIGKRGAEDADKLAQLEALSGAVQTSIRMGVVKPLCDLVLDWSHGET